MTKHLYRLGIVLAVGAGFALAQSTATSPATTPKTFPDQTQTPSAQQNPSSTSPSSPDQMPSSSQTPSSSTTPSAPSSSVPDQSSAPATSSPQTDQSTSPSSASPASPSSSQSSTAPASSSSSASGMPQSDMGAAGDTSKIQAALQQNPNLSGISVNATDKGIELTGSANSSKDHKDALRIAKENAGGKKIIDHIQVANAPSGTSPSNPK